MALSTHHGISEIFLLSVFVSSFVVASAGIFEENFDITWGDDHVKMLDGGQNADQWATRGGRVKTNWTNAPFTAYYRNYKANACVWPSGPSSCASLSSGASPQSNSQTQGLDAKQRRFLRWVQKNFMIYNYCTDLKRFPTGRPRECRRRRYL